MAANTEIEELVYLRRLKKEIEDTVVDPNRSNYFKKKQEGERIQLLFEISHKIQCYKVLDDYTQTNRQMLEPYLELRRRAEGANGLGTETNALISRALKFCKSTSTRPGREQRGLLPAAANMSFGTGGTLPPSSAQPNSVTLSTVTFPTSGHSTSGPSSGIRGVAQTQGNVYRNRVRSSYQSYADFTGSASADDNNGLPGTSHSYGYDAQANINHGQFPG